MRNQAKRHHRGISRTGATVTIFGVLFTITACTTAPRTPEATTSAPAVTNTPALTEEDSVFTQTTILFTFGDTTVAGTLWNNAASASLIAQMPLELSFSDFGGQEKIATLPERLSLDGMPSGSAAEPGTIGYYAPAQALVLYYESVGYYTGIIPIGTFEDVATTREAPAFVATLSSE